MRGRNEIEHNLDWSDQVVRAARERRWRCKFRSGEHMWLLIFLFPDFASPVVTRNESLLSVSDSQILHHLARYYHVAEEEVRVSRYRLGGFPHGRGGQVVARPPSLGRGPRSPPCALRCCSSLRISHFLAVVWAIHPDLIPREVGCVISEPVEPFVEHQSPLFLCASKIIHYSCDTRQFCAFVKVLEVHDFTLPSYSNSSSSDSSKSRDDGYPEYHAGRALLWSWPCIFRLVGESSSSGEPMNWRTWCGSLGSEWVPTPVVKICFRLKISPKIVFTRGDVRQLQA
jgi:hypothetical protein